MAEQQVEDWLTVGEAARLAGVSTDSIRRYNNEGILPARRTRGGQRRFRRSDVLAFCKAGDDAEESA